MRTIWKYSIPLPQGRLVSIPRDATFLCAMRDPQGDFALWFEVDDEVEQSMHCFVCAGTGGTVPYGSYITSVVDGQFVWHIYEVPVTEMREPL